MLKLAILKICDALIAFFPALMCVQSSHSSFETSVTSGRFQGRRHDGFRRLICSRAQLLLYCWQVGQIDGGRRG